MVSLAFSRASSIVSNGRTARTGPKTSFWTISLSWAQSTMSVGPVEGAVRKAGHLRPIAAGDDAGAGRHGSLDEAVRPRDLGLADERAEVRRRIERVADPDGVEQLGRPRHERVVHAAMDVGARRRRAVLAAVDERARRRAARGGFDVRVRADDERRLAAELQVDALEVRRPPAPGSSCRSPCRRSAR